MRLNRKLGLAGVAAVVVLLVAGAPVLASEGHGHGSTSGSASVYVWGLLSLGGVFVALVSSRALLARRLALANGQAGGADYLAAIRLFSRNAKLFLTYSLLAELGSGIWAVMFNLYLLRVGYPITFVGLFLAIMMTSHGLAALPAGLIADRFGRRRSFFIATFISLTAQVSVLFVDAELGILALAGVAGFGEAFHGVTGAPFMMENSEPKERVHLFSLNAAFLQASRFGGNLVGGFLPLLFAGIVGVPSLDPAAARWALVVGPPLTMMALVPLIFMREKPPEHVPTVRELLDIGHLPNLSNILKLTALSLMLGTAFGLTIRFFNVFFVDGRGATDGQTGTILGLGAVAGAGAILVSPLVTMQYGKVKGIAYTQMMSVPFLLLMAMVPSLSVVTVFFLVRGAMYSIAAPMRNQLSMELVSGRERGTTAGFTHAAFDLGGAGGAGMAGVLMAGGGFATAFTVAAGLIAVPAVLYYVFFARADATARSRAPAGAPAMAAGG